MIKNKPYRILLIDDQESIHEDYRKILGIQHKAVELAQATAELFDDDPATLIDWEGFELDSALQGEEGFRLVQNSIAEGRPYAMAFVDIRMPPGWDGVETVRRIWEVDPEILIVICSAYSDYSWEEMVRQLGRSDRFLILRKPFDNIEVRQCAMAMTERWSVARTDVLTGLLNRRAFHGHLELEWSRSNRHNFPLSCVMFDVDHFKRINDAYGHQAGDQALKTIAQLVRDNCRASDYVCRCGGEELCVLLPHANEDGAATWARHIRAALEAAPIACGNEQLHVTASFGVSQLLEGDTRPDDLVDRADQALLVAKKLGRNRVVRYSTMGESNRGLDRVNHRASLFQNVIARQVMTSPVVTLKADTTAGEAADFFLQFRINSAPVVDADGKLVGILSDKEVIGLLYDQEAWNTPIEAFMQRNVVCYDEDTSAQVICDFLSHTAVRRVVIARDNRPVGMLSRGSLLRWYSNWQATHPAGLAEQPGRQGDAANRHRMIAGAAAVAQCAAQLSQTVSGEVDDLVPPVIEGVSKLQELLNDLLSCSHQAS